jgi:imidazolonepropionase-like amidohydrolase
MDGQIGSLRPGRQADIVIWDGDPSPPLPGRRNCAAGI